MRIRETVIAELKFAVTEERKCTSRILRLLQEVDQDRHYLEMGFPSLFDFATKELGYSPAAAYRRIQSMRLLKAMPELVTHIEEGALSLCVAAKTQSFFRKEADRRKEAGVAQLDHSACQGIAQSMLGLSTRECERKLVVFAPEMAIPSELSRPVAPGKTLIKFVADDVLLAKLEKLKLLLGNQVFDGRYDRLFSALADVALKKVEKAKPLRVAELVVPVGTVASVYAGGASIGAIVDVDTEKVATAETQKTIRASCDALPPLEGLAEANAAKLPESSGQDAPARKLRSRYISAKVRRAVWLRDYGRCQFLDSRSQRRCLSKFSLEVDHIEPFALNGGNSVENLRLYCRAHNQYRAEQSGLSRGQKKSKI